MSDHRIEVSAHRLLKIDHRSSESAHRASISAHRTSKTAHRLFIVPFVQPKMLYSYTLVILIAAIAEKKTADRAE